MQINNIVICSQVDKYGAMHPDERYLLKQSAEQFIEKLTHRSLIKFNAKVKITHSSFYLEFTNKNARILSLRLSDHNPCMAKSTANEQTQITTELTIDPLRHCEQSKAIQTAAVSTEYNPINEMSKNNLKSNLKGTNCKLMNERPQSKHSTATNKPHQFPSDPKQRKGNRILWSWPYEAFETWEDFERKATKIVRNWLATECVGGKMATYDKERF